MRTLLALLLSAALPVREAWSRPRWTRAKPHFETRDGRRVAVATGKAKDPSRALARAATEEHARADLLRLLQGKPSGADVEGLVKGAQPTAVYERGRWVYVRLELDLGVASLPSGR